MELYWDTVSSHPKAINLHFKQSGTPKKLHGINWNNRKLEYTEFSSIVHQHCSHTTKYFATELEKCNLLSNYLCKDVDNLDDLGCPKISKILNNSDTDWDCSNYWYRLKKTFHCAEKKAYAKGIRTLDFLITYYFCIF